MTVKIIRNKRAEAISLFREFAKDNNLIYKKEENYVEDYYSFFSRNLFDLLFKSRIKNEIFYMDELPKYNGEEFYVFVQSKDYMSQATELAYKINNKYKIKKVFVEQRF